MIHIYRMNDVDWLGAYREANVMVGARLPEANIEGAYSPFLFRSSDGGVIQGREVHGQPRKLGEPRLEARGDLWVGTVAGNGIDVVTGTLAHKQHRDRLESLTTLLPFATNIDLKAIDHIDGRPAIRQLTSRFLTDVIVHECWSGPCSVELRANMQAPVFRLPVREPLAGFYWRADFTLVAGRILFDYLAHERS